MLNRVVFATNPFEEKIHPNHSIKRVAFSSECKNWLGEGFNEKSEQFGEGYPWLLKKYI